MSSQLAAERQKLLQEKKDKGPRVKPPPRNVSKNLYENPPRSKYLPIQLVYNLVHLVLIYMSKLVLGQRLLSIGDYFLEKLESTLTFCIPKEVLANEASTSTKPLTHERPMNWVLFIPVLIVVRMVFLYLSVITIVFGKGEVNATEMRKALIDFRRYYRSVRHFAVRKYTTQEISDRELCRQYFMWRVIYNVYESIIMTSPPREIESLNPAGRVLTAEEQTDIRVGQRDSPHVKKNSLNQIDDDRDDISTDDGDDKEEMTTHQLLEKYAAMKDTSADPDYEPSDEPQSEEISTEAETSSEDDETESQRKHNDTTESALSLSANTSNDQAHFEPETLDTSKTTTLSEKQMMELEDQLVMKIMSHFKDNFNYSPNAATSEDVFYSPIGSPPETGSAPGISDEQRAQIVQAQLMGQRAQIIEAQLMEQRAQIVEAQLLEQRCVEESIDETSSFCSSGNFTKSPDDIGPLSDDDILGRINARAEARRFKNQAAQRQMREPINDNVTSSSFVSSGIFKKPGF